MHDVYVPIDAQVNMFVAQLQVASALLLAFVPACLVNMEGGMKLE